MNLDGNSSLRRSCNLSFACNYETSFTDYYWTMNTKFKLLFGLKNYINSDYPEIIWFKLGTYVITSFSYNYSTSGMSVSISGKDKMCLINGDVSGEIYASVDFGTREEIDSTTGVRELVDINIEDIIREAVHEYGHEPWENIIIKDLPKYGLFLLEWSGDTPLYVLMPADGSDEATQVYLNQNQEVYVNGETPAIRIDQIPHYLSTNELTLVDKSFYTKVTLGEGASIKYFVCKINPGQSAGYDVTELTYPRNGEESGLITGVGDSVTSVLDKIVDFLGNYEYFFNVDGQFIFQKKDKWIDTNWNSNDFSTSGMGNDYTLTSILKTDWQFEGSELVTDFNNSPNIGNIKNDFTIWGERESGDTTLPLHMRYAVDKKPMFYKSVSYSAEELQAFKKLYPDLVNMDTSHDWPSVIYCTEEYPQELLPVGITVHREDWRELIYQMALDYRRFNHFDTFNARVLQANTIPNKVGGQDILYPKGITGYEQYYVDLEGFWRYLYRPEWDSPVIETTGFSLKSPKELEGTTDPIYSKERWEECTSINESDYMKATIEGREVLLPGPKDEKFYDLELSLNRANYSGLNMSKDTYYWKPWLEPNVVPITYTDGTTTRDIYHAENGYWFFGLSGNTLVHPEVDLEYGGCGGNGTTFDSFYLFYDNGNKDDNLYNQFGTIVTRGTVTENLKAYKSLKYNRILPIKDINDLSILQENDGRSIYYGCSSLTEMDEKFKNFNYYTIYRVPDTNSQLTSKTYHYYMYDMDSRQWQTNIENYAFPYLILREVTAPSLDGIKYKDTDEQVFRGSANLVGTSLEGSEYFYTKVSSLSVLPPKTTYLSNFYSDIFGTRYKANNNGVWELKDGVSWGEEYDATPIKKTSLNYYLNSEEWNEIEESLYKYNDNLLTYYTFLNVDNFGRPIMSEGQYTYKHEPIAYYQKVEQYEYDYDEEYSSENKWNVLKNESPELLLFWFDFLDSETSEIGKYGVNNVMDRSKASNESNVKAIYYRDTLNIVYQHMSDTSERYQKLLDYTRSGYNIIQAGDWIWDYFTIANCGKSCKDVLDEWLQAYTQANESVSISCIPIYTLEPNNRISVHDDNIKINGEYIINSISIPLTYNGTMSINATKAVDKLY